MSKPRSQHDADMAAVAAEASAWLVLLHGPRRTPAAERGFQAWLAEKPLHRKAFETATDVWMRQRGLVRNAVHVEFVLPRYQVRRRVAHLAWATAASLAIAVSGFLYWTARHNVTTSAGEQRNLTLEDGTRVSLNTSTRVRIEYSKTQRRVQLDAGEALFDVAQRAERPFVVAVGEWEVRALGTAFLIRREEERSAITLMEGKVAVTRQGRSEDKGVILSPGQQLTLGLVRKVQKLDQQSLAGLTAWRQGYVQIDNLTLGDAIAEMNRYSSVRLIVEGDEALRLRVSGVFRAGDVRSFAHAIALTHGLQLHEEGAKIVLSGVPHEATEAYFNQTTR